MDRNSKVTTAMVSSKVTVFSRGPTETRTRETLKITTSRARVSSESAKLNAYRWMFFFSLYDLIHDDLGVYKWSDGR